MPLLTCLVQPSLLFCGFRSFLVHCYVLQLELLVLSFCVCVCVCVLVVAILIYFCGFLSFFVCCVEFYELKLEL